MDKDIKTEFKEFIAVLTTEICKEVLLEDLKAINGNLNKNSKTYSDLNNKYGNKVKEIEDQLNQLNNKSKSLSDFISSAEVNNTNVNKALSTINGGHREVINKIIADNTKLLAEHSKNVQALNQSERNKFNNELSSTLDKHSNKTLMQVDKIVNGGKVEEIIARCEQIFNKSKTNEALSTSLSINIEKLKELIIEENSKTLNIVENKINTQSMKFNNSFNQFTQNMDEKIDELNNKLHNKLHKQNKIIISLSMLIVFISIISIIMN